MAEQKMEYKVFPAFEVKVLDEEQGICEELIAVFGILDDGSDILHPGSWRKTIVERGHRIRVVDQHKTDSISRVLGKPLAIREVGRMELPQHIQQEYPEATGGVIATTQYLMGTPEGAGAFIRRKSGAVPESSFGYSTIQHDYSKVKDRKGNEVVARNLREVKVFEYGPVLWGMNPATATLSVKAAGPTEFKPYRAVQRGDKWQVYKLDADDEPEGESLGEHDTEEEAQAQVRALYANEPDAEKARGEGQGVGGPRQGDGGADVCICPKCGTEAPHEKGVPCAEQKCPECGALMEGKEAGEVPEKADSDTAGETKAVTKSESDGDHPAGHYLVVENPFKPSTWHLRVRGMDGKPDHGLMGAAWAALHGGYRGNKYEGPQKAEAMKKLRALYRAEDMETPKEGEGPADEKEITPEGPIRRMGDVLQGSLHQHATMQIDGWYTDGLLSREEHQQMNGLIDDLLQGLTSGMPLDVATRRLSGWGIGYGRMGADGPEEEKIGRVLSSRNVGRIRAAIDAAQSALDALEEMLESAGIGEPAEPEGPEETTSVPDESRGQAPDESRGQAPAKQAADDGHNNNQAGPDLASPNPPTWNGTERERLLKRVQLLRASLPLEV